MIPWPQKLTKYLQNEYHDGAKVPRLAKLQKQIKNLLTQEAQDHEPMSEATIQVPDVREQLQNNFTEKLNPKRRIYEDGNSNNIYNFELEIAAVAELGVMFAPSNTLLQRLHLNAVLTEAQQAMADVNTMFNTLKRALDERQMLYDRMLKIDTRIMGELRSCGASKKTIEKATSYNAKIQGRRVKKLNPDAPDKAISASNTSFAQRFNNFDGLIGVCELEPLYNPSVDTLKVVDLKAFLQELKDINSAVAKAKAKLKKARTLRNKILYHPVTGMVDIAKAVKEYVKAVFGFKSPEYREVHHLKFRNRPMN